LIDLVATILKIYLRIHWPFFLHVGLSFWLTKFKQQSAESTVSTFENATANKHSLFPNAHFVSENTILAPGINLFN